MLVIGPVQVTLPRWLGRLPFAVTQLVLSPYNHSMLEPTAQAARPTEASAFFGTHLPSLSRLRHLAFHNEQEIGNSLMQHVCAAVQALNLISLHLVRLSAAQTQRGLSNHQFL